MINRRHDQSRISIRIANRAVVGLFLRGGDVGAELRSEGHRTGEQDYYCGESEEDEAQAAGEVGFGVGDLAGLRSDERQNGSGREEEGNRLEREVAARAKGVGMKYL